MTEPGACGDPGCYVLHADPSHPIHPPDYKPKTARLLDPTPSEPPQHDCGHTCCDERHDPMHDHFLAADNCPSCVSGTP